LVALKLCPPKRQKGSNVVAVTYPVPAELGGHQGLHIISGAEKGEVITAIRNSRVMRVIMVIRAISVSGGGRGNRGEVNKSTGAKEQREQRRGHLPKKARGFQFICTPCL
jgi:hypothetical protein